MPQNIAQTGRHIRTTAVTNDGAQIDNASNTHQNEKRTRMIPIPRGCGDDCCLRTISMVRNNNHLL